IADLRPRSLNANFKELTMNRRTGRRLPRRLRSAALKRGPLLGLTLGAAITTALASPAGAASPGPVTDWTRCSLHVRVAGVGVSPVGVSHVACAKARHAIQRAKIVETPGGPIFSTRGYKCSSKGILPRVDPSPIQLPAAERCTGAKHRRLSFIWDWAG